MLAVVDHVSHVWPSPQSLSPGSDVEELSGEPLLRIQNSVEPEAKLEFEAVEES